MLDAGMNPNEEKPKALMEKLDTLGGSLVRLEDEIASLKSKLSPVLLDPLESKSADGSAVPASASSPASDAVDGYVRHVDYITTKLEELRHRLDLN